MSQTNKLKGRKLVRLFLLVLLLFAVPLASADASGCDKLRARAVVDALLNRDLTTASELVENWGAAAPQNILVPLYRTMIEVARADYSVSRDTEKYTPALQQLDFVIGSASAMLETEPLHHDARLSQATAQAVAGRLLMEQARWLKAYHYGQASRETMRDLLQQNPTLEDARLILGLFEYFTGTLPGVLRWLAVVIDFSGDPQAGVAMLEQVVQKAQVASPQAADALLLQVAHTPAAACRYRQLAQLMQQTYPRNFRYRRAARALILACETLDNDSRAAPKQFHLALPECP